MAGREPACCVLPRAAAPRRGVCSGAALFSGGPLASAAYALFFFWVAVSAFYFFHAAYGVFCASVSSACYLGVLLIGHHELIALNWVMMTGALFVAGVLVGRLRSRVDGLFDELAYAARTDSLTGLANRREFEERLREEIARAERQEIPLSVLALDLDSFKAINDHQGHHAGDLVLQRVGAALRGEGRTVDTLARIGGDEFMIVATGAADDDAELLSRRLRQAVAEEFLDEPAPVTLSVGIASHPAHSRSFDGLREAADMALYAAKRCGGNRVVTFEPVMAERLVDQPSATPVVA